MFSKEDLELKLLRGKPLDIGIGIIHPLTLDEIVELGYSRYNHYLTLLTIDKSYLENQGVDIDLSEIKNFDIIYENCLHHKDFLKEYFDMLELFFKEPVSIGDGFFYFGDINEIISGESKRVIYRDNFDEIVELIKQLNNISSMDTDLNPANAKAKEILEKRQKAREVLAKVKNADGDSEPLTLSDLVSILCANGNNINLSNVWDLTIYQFNNQFNRMKMLENFNINIRSLLAGADPQKVELKHWMSKIK